MSETGIEDHVLRESDPVAAYLAHVPPSAAGRKRNCLGRAAGFLSGGPDDPASVPWHLLQPAHAAALRQWTVLCYSPAAANAILTSLRGVLRWAEREGALAPEECRAATRALGGRRRGAATAAAGLGSRALRTLLFACQLDATRLGRRDAAIVALLAAGGLTAADVAGLRWSDFDEEQGFLLVRRPGAGRALIIGDNPGLDLLLRQWKEGAGAGDDPIFHALSGSNATWRPLSPSGVASVLRRRAREAGMTRLRPADLARGYWFDLTRRADAGGRPCSLVTLEDGSCWLGSPALQLPAD